MWDTFFLLCAAAVFGSFGWAMRGCMIGGEMGAILPGAMLGMFVALHSGSPAYQSLWPCFAAMGALTMFYGGTEPYAQTMGWILHRREQPAYRKRLLKAYFGLFLKGSLWFGLCGTGLGLLFGAYRYSYSKINLPLLFLAAPLIQFAGVLLFNHPYDPQKKKFPKLYFSETSREEWGGNLLLFLLLMILAYRQHDKVTVIIGTCGFLSGGIGFVLGIFLYDMTAHPMKNGKYLFGFVQEEGYLDNWKLMEFVLGASGGAGLMLGVILCRPNIQRMGYDINNYIPHIRMNQFDELLPLFLAAAILAMAAGIFLDYKKPSLHWNASELLTRPFMSSYLTAFVITYNWKASWIAALGLPIFVMWLHNMTDGFRNSRIKIPVRIFLTICMIATAIWLALGKTLSEQRMYLLYFFSYTSITLLETLSEGSRKELAAMPRKKRLAAMANPLLVQGTFLIIGIAVALGNWMAEVLPA